jgi:hypothetical protein
MKIEPVVIKSAKGTQFSVYTNPSSSELIQIGTLVRFTADRKKRNIYVWNFSEGHHLDVSIGLRLSDSFDSVDYLRGHASISDDGIYRMVGSDFLQSFIGRMTGKDKLFLNDLLSQDWNGMNDYIQITGWIDSFKRRLGLTCYRQVVTSHP